MKVTRHNLSKKYTIEVTEKEMDAICFRIAREEGYLIAKGTLRTVKLLDLMRTSLRNCETDWD